MKRGNEIAEELNELGSTLATLDRRMPYAVPDGYFAHVTAGVQTVIASMEQPEPVPAWGKTMPYAVPAGYFDTLASDVVANLADSTPSVALPKNLPFSAPAGYFDALPGHLLAAAKTGEAEKKETVVIPLKRSYTIRPVRWAAAAILLICICLGGYMYFAPQQNEPEQMLAMVPANEIHDYLQGAYRFDVDRVINNDDLSSMQLDNADIVEYLNETGWDVAD